MSLTLGIITEAVTLIAEIKEAKRNAADPALRAEYDQMIIKLQTLVQQLEDQIEALAAHEGERYDTGRTE